MEMETDATNNIGELLDMLDMALEKNKKIDGGISTPFDHEDKWKKYRDAVEWGKRKGLIRRKYQGEK